MKCPVCQAKLMPVDGELFCLQCGNALSPPPGTRVDDEAPTLEETTDPLLQRAIVDAVHHDVKFKLPVHGAQPMRPVVASFASMRAVLAPSRVAVGGGNAAALATAVPVAVVAGTQVAGVNPVAPMVAAGSATGVAGLATAAPTVANDAGGLKAEAEIKPEATGTMRVRWRLSDHPMLASWGLGVVVFAAFVVINVGLSMQYAHRVYPGVKVGDASLGGVALDSLDQRLATIAGQPTLTVQMGASDYELDTRVMGGPDLERLKREVRDVGHTTPLPILGVLRGLVSAPITVHYMIRDTGVKQAVAALAQKVDRPASRAVPIIMNGQAFVIAEKPGYRVDRDKLEQAIRLAFGEKSAVSFEPTKVDALVTAGSYKADVEEAQARLGLSVQVKIRGATYSPTVAQVGSWLVFTGSGKGVVVDGANVAGYVAGLPGVFDRVATTNAVIEAIQNNHSVTYTALTKRNKAAPTLASVAPALPLQSYSYCLEADTAAGLAPLVARTGTVLADPAGWALGGRLQFERVERGCSVTIKLVKPEAMVQVDARCAGQTTCQSGAQVAISTAAWSAAPAAWMGTLDGYRGELINHEVGHWLGFDHASCLSKTTAQPVSQAATVMVAGCSPSWYAIPTELQGTKVLPGF